MTAFYAYVDGSSPLARGLLAPTMCCPNGRRIIPARAGFTVGVRAVHFSIPDHPRSRGVYHAPCVRASDFAGSSPLARGLPVGVDGERGAGGIIPARAGFTPRSRPPRGGPSDHPRSRGVYGVILLRGALALGSSPLARGLPSAPRHHSLLMWDHPRSRGVYGSRAGPQSPRSGSSPLARGLRGAQLGVDGLGRIIPARAGFTRNKRNQMTES